MDTRTYTYTPAQLSAISDMFAQADVKVNFSQPGEAVEKGWDINWTFPTPTTVAITVNKHPWGEENFLWTRLDKMFTVTPSVASEPVA